MRLPRWFSVAFVSFTIIVVIPMLSVWPLALLGQPDEPRPTLRLPESASDKACRGFLTELLAQLQDYTSRGVGTARNLGGKHWLETMKSWQRDLERVSTLCSLEAPTQDAQKKLSEAYRVMRSLAETYVQSMEGLSAEREKLLAEAKKALSAAE